MKFFGKKKPLKKELQSFDQLNNESVAEDFAVQEKKSCTDPYLQHAWVSVCIDILTRNVARAEFEVKKKWKARKGFKACEIVPLP